MRNKRREKYEDKRLDWRDPSMPVFCLCDLKIQHPDGRVEYRSNQMITLTPEQRQQASANCLKDSHDPDWRSDSTYYARKSRKKR